MSKNDVFSDRYVVDGRSYETLYEMASDYGISSSIVESRLLYGYTNEEAVLDRERFKELSRERRKSRSGKVFVFRGLEYSTLRKLAKAMKIKYADLLREFESGSIRDVEIRDRVVERKPGRVYQKRVFVEMDGVTYYTCKAYAEAYGFDVGLFRSYLRKTGDVVEASRLISERKKEYVFEGVPYRSLRAVARAANVKYAWLLSAVRETENVDDAVEYARETATLQKRRFKNTRNA